MKTSSFPVADPTVLGLVTALIGGAVFGASPVFEAIQAVIGPPLEYDSTLFQATDGTLYGVTLNGGTTDFGSIFKVAPDRALSTLVNFSLADAWNARAPLVQGPGGFLIGTSGNGGVNNAGMIFKMTPDGALTTLHDFNRTDGYFPIGTLVADSAGNFYGVTGGGGTNELGTVFKMNPEGGVTKLRSLTTATGYHPSAGLIRGTNGYFYGTAYSGGANGLGTVFRINSSGELNVLFSFNSTSGSHPSSELVQGNDGNLYGTTDGGGSNGDGTVFRMTPGGNLATLVSFADGLGGKSTQAGLAKGPDGNFYSTTHNGGDFNKGSIYKITPEGILTTLVSFDGENGKFPNVGLATGRDGDLYGTTTEGGTTSTGVPVNGGQIFRLRFGPAATTKAATRILTTSVILNGLVDPGGLTTGVSFEYGISPTLVDFTASHQGTYPGAGFAFPVQNTLSGLQPDTTYYFRIVATNADLAAPKKGFIASFTTLPATTPAADLWRIENFAQSANSGDAAEDADPDHDQLPNLLERAFNLNPKRPDTSILIAQTGISGLPSIKTVMAGADHRLSIEYIRRTATSNPGMIYLPQFGDDPGAPELWSESIEAEMVTPINSDWERVVAYDASVSADAKRFGRLKVSTTP